MSIKYYVDRWTLSGWMRITEDLKQYHIAMNVKESLALRYRESVDNFSVVVVCGM